ncbi:MAG TPA: hypothetical protein VE173_14225, partial [Longimicrobiales bacterium]|nr:hypothetical protein [Longimicrobiales bacterium]
LPEAVKDMETAEGLLEEQKPQDALAPEQRALRVLQKAEESYERFVQQQQGGGGGGSRGQGANADDLADLFELELDKLQNQYETVQRGERQQADQQVDELMEKLQELARRQQQEMERQRRRAAGRQTAGGGSAGQSQRELADQAEEAARQLERLARESGDPDLQETARRLRDAAEAMRRSAASSGRDQGVAEAGSALDDLEEAQRRLQRTREDRMRESARDAMERVDRLARSQEQVQKELEGLSTDPSRRADQVRRMLERKDEMVRETQDLETQLKRMATDARRDDPEAARELDEAAKTIEDTQLMRRIAYSKGLVEQRSEDPYTRDFEEETAGNIEELRQKMGEAARAAERIAEDRSREEALERAQDLVRGTESLTRRLQNRGQQDRPGEESQQGQQDQQGGQGQAGQQGGGGDNPPDSTRAAGEARRLQGQEGRQGQPGQQGQQGRTSSDQAGAPGGGGEGDPDAVPGSGRRYGDPSFWGGAVGWSPRPFTDEEIRQYQREFGERWDQARELRRQLAEEGMDTRDLDEAIAAMERLLDRETYEDLPQVAVLQQDLEQSLKRLEFSLRRQFEGEGTGRASLSGSDEVPEGFRRLVEEYYRSLARGSSGGGSGSGQGGR